MLCFLHDHFDSLQIVKSTLNPASSEVYVFASGFKGISNTTYNNLLHIYHNFNDNNLFHVSTGIMSDIYYVVYKFVASNITALNRNIIIYYNYNENIVKNLEDFNEKLAREWILKYFSTNNFTLLKSIKIDTPHHSSNHKPNHGNKPSKYYRKKN